MGKRLLGNTWYTNKFPLQKNWCMKAVVQLTVLAVISSDLPLAEIGNIQIFSSFYWRLEYICNFFFFFSVLVLLILFLMQ